MQILQRMTVYYPTTTTPIASALFQGRRIAGELRSLSPTSYPLLRVGDVLNASYELRHCTGETWRNLNICKLNEPRDLPGKAVRLD